MEVAITIKATVRKGTVTLRHELAGLDDATERIGLFAVPAGVAEDDALRIVEELADWIRSRFCLEAECASKDSQPDPR